MTSLPFHLRAWQSEVLPAIDVAIANNQRPVVIAATGTGKTIVCAFVARKHTPCVVIVPTQKLVVQTVAGFAKAGIDAGHFYTKKKEIKDIIVCCRPSLAKLAEVLKRPTGVIIDEAHQDPDSLREALARLQITWLIGVSATPFHAEKAETLSLHDSVIWGCSLQRGLEDSILCPWRWVWRWKNGEPTPCDPGTEEIDLAVIEDIRREAPNGPGIVTAHTIADAHAFAKRLTEAGIPAAGISGKDSEKKQDALIEDLRAGRLAYLVQVRVLGEGVDLDFLKVVVFRDELSSRVRFIQIAGRAFRVLAGKKEAILIDPRYYAGRIRLNHDPRVGAEELDRALKEATERGEVDEAPPVILSGPVALSATALWLAQVWDAYCKAGYDQPLHSPWRSGHATKHELAALRKKAATRTKVLPAPIRETIRSLVEVADHLSAADVALLFTILWSTGEYADKIRFNKEGGFAVKRWAFMHKKALLAALPGSLPEGCLEGLAVAETLFEPPRFKPWPGDPS